MKNVTEKGTCARLKKGQCGGYHFFMKRIAIIGAGYVGKLHGDAVNKSPRAELAALVDASAEPGKRAADELGCPFYTDMAELFARENVDIVNICLPSFLHERFVLLAAEHGKHVICEKPFALSPESARRMKEACEKAGVVLMAAQVVRYMSEYREIRRLIEQGRAGNIRMAFAARLSQHPNWTSWHRDPEKSGGGLFDLHLHDIDYLYSLFGKVASVSAVGWKSPTGCWNHVVSSLCFANGVRAAAEGSMEMTGDYPFSAAFRAVGDRGTIEYRLSAGFNIENLAAAQSILFLFEEGKKPEQIGIPPGDGFQAEIDAFVEALEQGRPSPIDPADSLDVIRIIDALRNSLETGKTIALT